MDDLRDMLSRLWRGEQIVQHQTVRIDRSGKRMDVSLTISPFQNESGIIAGASEIARDITERARDEMKFRMAVEASPNGMVLVDSSGSILLINAEAERLFGYDREELLGQPVECLVPQRFRSDHPRLRSGYFSNPSMRTMGEGRDLFGLRKDGVEIPVEIGLNPIQTDTEVLVLAAVVDISERRQRDELVRIAFEAAPSGMLMVDQQGKITMVNSQLEGIFGYQRDEMLGSPVEMLLPKELRGEHAQLFAEFIKHPAPRAMGEGRVFVGVRKDEREVPIEIGLVPITHYQGIHVLAAIVDISERKKMDAQLRFKNEEMEQLLYVVSHDLKSPLVTIEGFSGFLLRYAKAGDLDKVEDAVGRIQRGVKSMARLIDDLLELSRVGRTENERLELDVRSIVSEVVESLDGAIRKAEAVVEVDEFLPNIQADHTQFVQVIMNLVANALKYGCPEPGCRIRIGAMRQPGQIKLFVRDEGPGIDAQFHAKIFQLFQRLSTDQEGTGLGLTTVARVMESHGGRVWVESQPGCGATFWISFPDHPAERAFALSKPAATELAATR
jgi:PAS domain S-box-containing protein